MKVVSPKRGSNNERQLHLCNIPSYATSWPIARDESIFLPLSQTVPSVWHEVIGIVSPNLLGVVDRVSGNREDGTRLEMLSKNLNSYPRRHNSREAEGRG